VQKKSQSSSKWTMAIHEDVNLLLFFEISRCVDFTLNGVDSTHFIYYYIIYKQYSGSIGSQHDVSMFLKPIKHFLFIVMVF